MKSRFLLLLLLAIILFVLLGRNRQEMRGVILGLVDPIKSYYKNFTRDLTDKSHSYLFQKEQIEKLTKENRVLRKYLLDQTHYLRQVASLYKQLPSLEKLPYKSITLVDTVSYVKLNKFDEILLTPPSKTSLKEGKVYGLIQEEVVAGTARMQGGILYGYLLPNPKCRFSVFVGPKLHPGIAEGVADKLMAVRFIPKWAKVAKGDLVETSGLDGIFFANIPVGVVRSVQVEGSYKTAYIQTYADTLHPRMFFLITDATPYLVSRYDQNSSFPGRPYPYASQPPRTLDKNISSVPETIQTKELQIDPSEFEIPKEPQPAPKPTPRVSKKKESPKASIPTKTPQSPKKTPTTPTSPSSAAPKPPAQHKTPPKEKRRPSPFDILNTTGL